ncbi:MAG: universal stress protein [Nitrospiraceae bacterium]|nr:universal stress protein [Nitrospiraceae bacterium]
MKLLIAYDGTLHAKKALRYGMSKVQDRGGDITVLQVFDPSLFIDYDAGPRAEEMARAEFSRFQAEARSIVSEQAGGFEVRFLSAEGDPLSAILGQSATLKPDLVLVTPQYKAVSRMSDRPVAVIPGTILAPVDSAGTPAAEIDLIEQEAKATGSTVLVLGIVPVHLYSPAEREELGRVQERITDAVLALQKTLRARGIEAKTLQRAGYPDEEILRAAADETVSLVLLPTGSATPSELAKASAMLQDEPERLRWPVLFVPMGELPA